MSNNGQFKRRNYFINKEFQGKTIFHYFILLALGSILFVGIFSFFSSNTLSIVYDNYHLRLGTTPGILFKKMLSTQWLFIVIGGIAVIFITMRLTHRVAGPFYRFEKGLDEMIDHDISKKIILRQKDEGKDLAVKINGFNSALSTQLALIGDANSTIAISARMLEKELSQPEKNPTEISRLIGIIKESQRNIETEINPYTFNTSLRP
ncbi:MAG: methyl-accepting chemotaxis protein [Desulfobacula sp.]|jgi:methyl-accepting chemotaxis protein|nr:methyl-accepting chemotaxis protein [Desulfobacula sp.]